MALMMILYLSMRTYEQPDLPIDETLWYISTAFAVEPLLDV